MTDERLVVQLVSVYWTHSSLDVRVDCHHLHEFSVEADHRPEPQGDVQGVRAGRNQREMSEVVGDEKCPAGGN